MRTLRIPALLAVMALVMAGCGLGSKSSAGLPSNGASTGASGSAAPSNMLTTLPPAEDELDLVIWTGYAEDGSNDPDYDWVTPFEKDTGCKVVTKDGLDSANMVSLMGSGQYDGVSASGDATLRMIAAGTVAPVNLDLIPNYANVFDGLKNQPHNTVNGVSYGTPHGRGANVLLYNTDTFKTPPTSWDVVWNSDSPAAGKISVYNSSIYIADAALHLQQTNPELGITDIYQLNDEQFNAAVDLLKKQHDIVGEYWNVATDQITSFGSKDMLAGTSWQYQLNTIKADNPDAPVAATLPDEGSTGWSDTWMISSTAKHPGCMYRWMNWMLDPHTNALATIWFGEAPVSQQACDEAEKISPGHCDSYHATDEDYFSKVHFWSTPRADCNDDKADTTCKDIEDWIAAWTDITGG
ncbi:MAG TPA: extracellular solute-binding protein [Candidatus Limnocylindria bacterium]|jgi:putative spermidine/putrescine transport system substrate-binding protein|nr:extracellular solute-binding protein [Candidatus Limnocylindria bacterium]